MPTSTEPEGMPAWLPGDLPQDPPAAPAPEAPAEAPAAEAAETGTDTPAEIRAAAPAEVLLPAGDEQAAEPPAPDDDSAVVDLQALEAAMDTEAELSMPSAMAASASALDDDDDDEEEEDDDDHDDDEEEEEDDDENEYEASPSLAEAVIDDAVLEPDADELAAAFIIDGDGSDNVDALADLLGDDFVPNAEVVVLVADEGDEATLAEALADVLLAAPEGETTTVMVVEAYAAGEAEPEAAEPVMDEEAHSGPTPAEAAQEAEAVLEALADGTLPEVEASEETADAPADMLIAAPDGATSEMLAAAPYALPQDVDEAAVVSEALPEPELAVEPVAEPTAEPAPAKGRKRGKKAKAADGLVADAAPVAEMAAVADALADAAQAAQSEPAPEFRAVGEASLTDTVPLNLEAQLEALLFVADGATPVARLAEALEVNPREVESALTMLGESYRHRGLSLQRFRDKVQLTTAPAAAGQVERFLGLAAATPLSRAALEALAIIAYQQPVTRPQIEAVRGVNSDSVIKNLLSKGLVEEGGRAEGPGRPVLYSTTPEFMQHFGIASLADLPPLALPDTAPTGPTPDDLLKG